LSERFSLTLLSLSRWERETTFERLHLLAIHGGKHSVFLFAGLGFLFAPVPSLPGVLACLLTGMKGKQHEID
jgi:hypothetical protein